MFERWWKGRWERDDVVWRERVVVVGRLIGTLEILGA